MKIKTYNSEFELTSWNKIVKGCMSTASFTVESINGKLRLDIKDGLVGGIITSEDEIPIKNSITKLFDFMKDVVINDLEDNSVGILLGTRFIRHFFGGETRQGEIDEPIAIHTDFGWVVAGPVPDTVEFNPQIAQLGVTETELENIDRLIRYMYAHDFLIRKDERFPPEYTHNSQNDNFAVEQLQETVTFDKKEGRYSVGLPWTHGRLATKEIFDNTDFYAYASNRTRNLRRKLEKDPILKEGSFAQVEENLANGYSKIITDLSSGPDSPVCYLACHVALHPDKPGKFRVCQDAAGKVDGKCLNDFLLKGPDVMNSLFGIILRFRQHKVVLSADIKDFFYRILLDEKDRASARFFWYKDRTMKELIVIEALCHLFGFTSSPGVATVILQMHGTAMREEYGLDVMIAILLQFYVDDYLASLSSVEKARVMKEKLTEALKKGGFHLTKWRSNIPELNDPEPTPPPNFDQEEDQIEKKTSGEEDVPMEVLSDEEYPSPSITDLDDDENEDRFKETEELQDELTAAFQNHDQGEKIANEFTKDPGNKILGVGYDYESDQLYVRVKEKLFGPIDTKRDLLSHIASIYDPLGFVGPYILVGRILFQELNLAQKIKQSKEKGPEVKGPVGKKSKMNPWNEKVPGDILAKFEKWRKDIILLRNLKIPRWTSRLGMEDSVSKLILFCDASCKGYGMVAYVRRNVRDNEENVMVSFLASKSHVVPLAMLEKLEGQEDHCDSIPKLELDAAVLSARMRDIIIRLSDEIYDEIIMYSDSMTVLNWINSWEHRLKSYENFRVLKIRLLSKIIEWYYIATHLNPADFASKGIQAKEDKKWTMFHKGPDFLYSPSQEWPREKAKAEKTTKSQLKALTVLSMASPVELRMEKATEEEPAMEDVPEREPWPITVTKKLETWESKVRRVAIWVKICMFFRERALSRKANDSLEADVANENTGSEGVYNLRSRKNKQKEQTKEQTEEQTEETKAKCFLNLKEKESAEKLVIKAIQSLHFYKELATLYLLGVFEPNSFKELKNKNSKLVPLSPFIDEEGIMRVGGRLGNSTTLPFNTKHPVILPNADTEIIQSLIRKTHLENYHCSQVETYFLVKQKYYLLGGRNTVKKVITRCVDCQLASKRPSHQKMGDLPEANCSRTIPFSTSGLDVFGHFECKWAGRGELKRWVLLITCLTTRAVQLYPLADLSLSTVIGALLKMSNQFPSLKKIISDNGSNFRGANREIREARESWDNSEATDKLSDVGLEWTFGPAACGSWGGTWERLIGIVKNAFKACMGRKHLSVEEFDALCSGVSGVVNRRPLTRPDNPDEMFVLTPAHLIYPYNFSFSSSTVVPPISDAGDHLRSTWRNLRTTLDDFWAIWTKQYVTELIERTKWKTATQPLKVGDVCLLKEPIVNRENWKMGRITKIISGDKERACSYELKDAYGNFLKRHRTSLINIEMS